MAVYTGLSAASHDALENHLTMACQRMSERICWFLSFRLLLSFGHEYLSRMLLRVKMGFSCLIDVGFYVWRLSINKSVYFILPSGVFWSKGRRKVFMLHASHADLLNSVPLCMVFAISLDCVFYDTRCWLYGQCVIKISFPSTTNDVCFILSRKIENKKRVPTHSHLTLIIEEDLSHLTFRWESSWKRQQSSREWIGIS